MKLLKIHPAVRRRGVRVHDRPGLGAGAAACAGHDLLHAQLLVLGAVAGAARRALWVSWTVWVCSWLAGVMP